MRLIDADKLEFVPALIEPVILGDKAHWEIIILRDRIYAAPAIDAVPVIHCKDCRWFKTNRRCIVWHESTVEHGYCYQAERRRPKDE